MNVEVTVVDRARPVIDRLVQAMGASGRADLNGVAANALKVAIQRHIRGYVMSKHMTAHRFGAQPTRHYEAGAAAISFAANDEEGVVTIPIPGISRAFGDVSIRPGPGKKALTLPLAAVAYGRTVGEVRAMGWNVFRPKGKDYLMGSNGEGEAVPLFSLRAGVLQRRDPSLLPTREKMAQTATKAVLARIKSILQKSGKAVA